ncbi:hypothetical protein ONA22_04435 [Mycoplasmopsis cynos]|nr:hypothetical protein [Mycoplasmopsis cynos]WAM04093.1 hypothetical protein ONA22_04435 [Mycoplasmopsis cynos]
MLNKYKYKDIVVNTVNYNQRNDSGVDFEIVKDFCELYNIPFEFLILKKDDYSEGNFQSWVEKKDIHFLLRYIKNIIVKNC